MKTLSAVIIIIGFIASLYYAYVGVMKPESIVIFNKVNMPHKWIQIWAFSLGVFGTMLLFPLTFKWGAILMLPGSLLTIACFFYVKDYLGGFMEMIYIQVPIFLLWVGYPISVLEKFKNWLF